MTVVQWSAAARVSGSDGDQCHRDTSSYTCVSPCTCARVAAAVAPPVAPVESAAWLGKQEEEEEEANQPPLAHCCTRHTKGESERGRRNKGCRLACRRGDAGPEAAKAATHSGERCSAARGEILSAATPAVVAASASLSSISLSCRCCHWMCSSSHSILTPLLLLPALRHVDRRRPEPRRSAVSSAAAQPPLGRCHAAQAG